MEALAKLDQFGVYELREDDLREVDGGGGRLFYNLGQYIYKVTHMPEPDYKENIKVRVMNSKMCLAL
jgi:hypothetical protein